MQWGNRSVFAHMERQVIIETVVIFPFQETPMIPTIF